MAEKINATCSICGKGYYKCISCQDKMKDTPWKQYTDTSEHYKIFQVIHGYSTGVYTKNEAKERLQTIDLSDLNELRENIRKIVNDIIKEDEKSFAVEDKPVVETTTERPSYMNRRKKYSMPEPVVAE